MTQDQYGQARGSGYVVPGDVVPEDETEEARTDESRPMTRFQKVASALRGGSERDERDLDADDRAAAERASADRTAAEAQAGEPESNPPWVTQEDEAAMADSPISREPAQKGDYWDDPNAAAGHEDAVAGTSPDTADRQPTDPDMMGAGRRTGEETAEMPAARAESQPGAATIADVPAARTPVGEPPVTETPAGEVAAPAGDVPAGDGPATAADATGSTGRHAAATTSADAVATPGEAGAIPADEQMRPGEAADPGLRPGEAAGKLGDFSDLTYGNLVPDAERFTAQWQEIQFRFVDDPRGSVTEAADIVAQVTGKMEAAIQERQRAIEERQRAIAEQQRSLRGRWGEDSNADTEALRETLRMYKTFLDQLIGSRTSNVS